MSPSTNFLPNNLNYNGEMIERGNMFCPKCGFKNPDGSRFCGSCGRSFEAVDKDSSSGAAPAPRVAPASTLGGASGAASKTASQTVFDQGSASVRPFVSNSAEPRVGTIGAAEAAVSTPAQKGSIAIKKQLIIPAVFVAVLLVFLAILFLTNGFGLWKPGTKGSVNEYSWGELSQISELIADAPNENEAIAIAKGYNLTDSMGNLDGTQIKTIQLSNGEKMGVQIVGFAHDVKTGGGKAGITFIFQNAFDKQPMNSANSNKGGWEKSELRSWLTSSGLAMLPSDLRDKIVSVNKMTNNSGKTEDINSVTTTSDKLWLFSAVELCGEAEWTSDATINNIINSEGSEYKLFRDAGVKTGAATKILQKNLNGEAYNWWERTANPATSAIFYEVIKNGDLNQDDTAPHVYGVVPGFCI